MLRKHKLSYKIGVAELTTEEIKPLAVINDIDMSDTIDIPLEDNTKEDIEYLEHKRKRNEQVFKKFEEWER